MRSLRNPSPSLCSGILRQKVARVFRGAAILALFFFLAQYFFVYLKSTLMYYITVIPKTPPFLAANLFLFAMITFVFYVGGFVGFLHCVTREMVFRVR